MTVRGGSRAGRIRREGSKARGSCAPLRMTVGMVVAGAPGWQCSGVAVPRMVMGVGVMARARGDGLARCGAGCGAVAGALDVVWRIGGAGRVPDCQSWMS